jgi:hypothetical protein
VLGLAVDWIERPSQFMYEGMERVNWFLGPLSPEGDQVTDIESQSYQYNPPKI